MWAYLALSSALLLGFYDICKKHSVKDNAVLPTLFVATAFGGLAMFPLMIISYTNPEMMKDYNLFVGSLTFNQHLLIVVKSLIVSASWVLSYFAIKHLPISIVTPVRASSPILTMVGAILIFNEMPNNIQWIGLAITMCSYYYFSILGKKEGIHFHRNKWIYMILAATIIGACSSIYDKFVIKTLGIDTTTMQVWFSYYLVIILGLATLIFWAPTRHKTTPFQWRWTIPMIGLLLMLADFFYFRSIGIEGALIMLISTIRRSSAVVSFTIGGLIFKDQNKRKKAVALAGILIGVILIILSK